MQIKAIHQFSPSLSLGDSITNALIYTQKILLDLGFDSKIYSDNIPKNLNFKALHIDDYQQSIEQVLLYHYAIWHTHHDKIMSFLDKKILVYHNITPSHFFKQNEFLQKACYDGRYKQLKKSKDFFIASYADSLYSVKELVSYGFKSPQVMPILVDFDSFTNKQTDSKILETYRDSYNILFIGRIVTNKSQDMLLDTIYFLQHSIKNIKLILVGSISDEDYYSYILNKIELLNLKNMVDIVGKVSSKELFSYYKVADIYLSLSEHEGFGMPLLEASLLDVPVFAYNTTGVKTAIGEEGLLDFKSPKSVARKLLEFIENPRKKVKLLKYQKEYTKRFSYTSIKERLASFLYDLGILHERISKQIDSSKTTNYLIEGAFDTSYSLCIVNRNLAKAMYDISCRVKLHSTEGYGDFEPDSEFLKKDAITKKIYNQKLDSIDVTIRNTYPPRTDAMSGYHRIIGPYGWEESVFLPRYVKNFNTRLTLVACMSSYVRELMINSGVTTPLFTIGIGADHVLNHPSKELPYGLPSGFKLLHISSCFPRKGVDVLLQVFDEISYLDISLVIKTFPNPHNNIKEQIEKLSSQTRKKILLINEELTPSQINYLYENCDVLVAPSKGEGFGLPMAEAMLFNLPVITTAYGGQRDFCHHDNSWLIDYSFAKADTHFDLFDSYWVEPSKQSLKNLILEIYLLPKEQINLKTKRAKETILSNHTWQKTVLRLQDAINNYEHVKDNNIKLAFITTYNTKCGIATYSQSMINFMRNSINSITIFANKIEPSQILNKDIESTIKRVWIDRFQNDNKELISALEDDFTHIVIEFNFAFFSIKNLKNIIERNLKKSIFLELHSVKDVTIKDLEASLGDIADTLKKINRIIVHNISDLNILKNFDIVDNVTLLPLGVDTSIPIQKEMIYDMATFGFLLPHKGVLELIETLYYVKKTIQDVNLLLLNALYPLPLSQEYLEKCTERIKELKLDENITFITDYLSKDEIYDYLSQAKLLVLLYKDTQESASASIRDAISTQKPILTTKQNIFNDVLDIIHTTNHKNPEAIAKDIVELLKDDKRLYSKLDIERDWLEEHDFKITAKKLVNILNRYTTDI